MKLIDIKKAEEGIKSLTEAQQEAIYKLIDLKTEYDMEKAIQEFEKIRISMEANIEKSKNEMIKWVIATGVALLGVGLALAKLL